MNKSIRMILTLVIIASISGIILAEVYNLTELEIKDKRQKDLEEAIFSVIPQAKSYTTKDYNGLKIYECTDKDGRRCGICFTAEGVGYQDRIRIMIGLNKDLSEIEGIRILEEQETPGLGGRINERWFQKQFEGRPTDINLKVVSEKPGKIDEIQAITGATISSNAVVNIVNKKIEEVKRIINK